MDFKRTPRGFHIDCIKSSQGFQRNSRGIQGCCFAPQGIVGCSAILQTSAATPRPHFCCLLLGVLDIVVIVVVVVVVVVVVIVVVVVVLVFVVFVTFLVLLTFSFSHYCIWLWLFSSG